MPNQDELSITRADIGKLLANVGVASLFDAEYYLYANHDIREMPEIGLANAFDHFLAFGFLEGRLPFRVIVDETYYLKSNPDVVAAIKERKLRSAQQHFDLYGHRESRLPYEEFLRPVGPQGKAGFLSKLRSHPQVSASEEGKAGRFKFGRFAT